MCTSSYSQMFWKRFPFPLMQWSTGKLNSWLNRFHRPQTEISICKTRVNRNHKYYCRNMSWNINLHNFQPIIFSVHKVCICLYKVTQSVQSVREKNNTNIIIYNNTTYKHTYEVWFPTFNFYMADKFKAHLKPEVWAQKRKGSAPLQLRGGRLQLPSNEQIALMDHVSDFDDAFFVQPLLTTAWENNLSKLNSDLWLLWH